MSITDFSQHAPLPYFEAREGELCIGGRRVGELAGEPGRTPFYAYDRAVMARKVAELRAVLPAGIELHYAIKANPMPELVAYLGGLVDGLDVASARELLVALGTRTAPEDVSFAGPGKSAADLAAAIGAGIVINAESEFEIERIAALARQTGTRPKVAIRVNPDFELKTSGMKMGGGPKQFGIDAERVPALLAGLGALPVEFWGFHLYTGSQNLRAESIVEAQQKCAALALELAAHAPGPVRMLNLGGGFGIPYFPGDKPLAIEPIGANLRELLTRIRAAQPQAKVVIELGRYLVGESGVYVCRVVDRKLSRGHVYLVTDGGLHHHLAASGNFGQVIRRNYPVVVANRIGASEREIASVVGPLCTPLDLLADKAELARAEVGDLIAVFMSGAYGYSASPLGFLSHPEPAQLLLG